MNVNERVLLTGAGFTKNFGAPLAADVWALLFNHPDVGRQPRVRNLLRTQFDFENVYHEIMTGNFNDRERSAMTRTLQDAYDYVDSIVRNYRSNGSSPNIEGVQKFLNAFTGNPEGPGFIFTLNQDLFMERHLYGGVRPQTPFIPQGRTNWFTSNSSNIDSPLEARVTIPDIISPSMADVGSDRFYYIKLHGSSNWNSSNGMDLMVIGRGKGRQIAKNSLLAFYADLFKEVLSSVKRVLCIGYSFGIHTLMRCSLMP